MNAQALFVSTVKLQITEPVLSQEKKGTKAATGLVHFCTFFTPEECILVL